jgi:hypothetical protein
MPPERPVSISNFRRFEMRKVKFVSLLVLLALLASLPLTMASAQSGSDLDQINQELAALEPEGLVKSKRGTDPQVYAPRIQVYTRRGKLTSSEEASLAASISEAGALP